MKDIYLDMNSQNILKFYGTRLDAKLDSSEFYDYEITKVANDYNTDVLDLYKPIVYESLKIDQFCNVKSFRQTLIYIDDDIIEKGDTQWALQLINKVMINLMPSESVTLIKLSSELGSTEERWKACYPDITVAELEKRKDSIGFLEKLLTTDASKQLKEQKTVFKAQMTGALGRPAAKTRTTFRHHECLRRVSRRGPMHGRGMAERR